MVDAFRRIAEEVPAAWGMACFRHAMQRCAHFSDVSTMRTMTVGRAHKRYAALVCDIVAGHASSLPELLSVEAGATDCQADMVAKTLPRLLNAVRSHAPISVGRIPNMTFRFLD